MSGPRPAGDDTAAGILLCLVGVGLALSELGAVAAAITSWVSGHGWRWTPLADAGPGLARLVAHPARPGAAFPPAVAGGVTSLVLFWAVTVLLVAALAGLAGYGTVLYGRHAPAGGRRDGARWGTGRDERRLAVPADPASRPGRLVAGRGQRCRRLIAGADCISAVVFGPNGSGKSTGLIAPNALEWAGPVVVTTTKPQDVDVLLAARAAVGSVYVIAPGGCPGVVTTGWSPVDYVTAGGAIDPEAADRMAEWLVETSGMNADPKSRPWNAQARKYLKGCCWPPTCRRPASTVSCRPPTPVSGPPKESNTPSPRPAWKPPAASTPPPGPSTKKAKGPCCSPRSASPTPTPGPLSAPPPNSLASLPPTCSPTASPGR